jgi:phosphate transport system protein
MAHVVQEMIAGAADALELRDSQLAQRMIERDLQVNRIELETDDLCLRILARRQPVATDLRFITLALKVVTDLERMGDLAVNICERVLELNVEAPLGDYKSLTRMAKTSQEMMKLALEAFVTSNVDLAQQVIDRDQVVDAYSSQVFREFLAFMVNDPQVAQRATRLQSIAKYLERTGDHATNSAEFVIFKVKGKDIRHTHHHTENSAQILPHGIVFVCVHNSSRSQIAEGFARATLPHGFKVWSAGSAPGPRVHPMAVEAMREVGIDISSHRPKPITEIPAAEIDIVIALCAEEQCVDVPGVRKRESWALPDPSAVEGDDETRLQAFRDCRDAIRAKIQALAKPFFAQTTASERRM